MMRFRFVALVCALSAAGATQAQSNGTSAAYPSRPIHWILPGAPGSPPDVAARIVGEGLAREVGQPVIVENRPGASGTIALATVAKSAPDGCTLGILSVPALIAPSLYTGLAYDVTRDFVPVAEFVQFRFLLAVRSEGPIRSVTDLIAVAKANPGRLTFASASNGTVPHLAGELLRQRAGIDIRHIPYKSGPFALNALLGGQVDMLFAPPSTLSPHIRSGKLHALATPSPSRLPEYPDVPTMAQVGLPGIEMGDWFGIVVPAGTPKDIVGELSAAVRKSLGRSDVKERLTAAGYGPVLDSSPDRFAAFVRSESKRWTAFVHEAGIRAD